MMLKHKFLLDENILYYAIRKLDEHGRSLPEAAKLISLIMKNCHKIMVDRELNNRFKQHLEEIKINRNNYDLRPGTLFTVAHLFHNSEKRNFYFEEIPPINNEEQYPRKDLHIVRAAIHFGSNVVTIDDELERSINDSSTFQQLQIQALKPSDALELARDS